MGGDRFAADSVGLEPGILNSVVVQVMKEVNIDISKNQTNSVFDFYEEGRLYQYVFTVCDKEAAEQCPIFPNAIERIHWSFTDPSKVNGDEEEKLMQIRAIRDEIKTAIKEWIASVK